MEWIVEEKVPDYLPHEFFVMIYNQVRKVKADGFGNLLFKDCNHPMQNIWCDREKVTAWTISS